MLQWIVKIDQHPPLYYLLLHYWIAINGGTPYYVRLLSVLFGTGTIPIIYLIGKRMSGVVMGLAAAALMALSLFNIYFAQETRMYTLMTFTAAVAIYALVRLLTDSRSVIPIGSQFREYLHAWRTSELVEPDAKKEFSYKDETRYQSGWRAWIFRHRWLRIHTIETDLAWVAFIVFSAATLLTHNTAVFFPAATNLFVLGLMLFQRLNKSGSQPGFQAPSFGNWVKSSDWHLPTMAFFGWHLQGKKEYTGYFTEKFGSNRMDWLGGVRGLIQGKCSIRCEQSRKGGSHVVAVHHVRTHATRVHRSTV